MTVGGIDFGTALMGLLTPRAPSNDLLNQLIKDKPEFYKFVDIDLSTARTDQVYDEPGTFIWVDNQFARGEVTLRLNELQFGKFDLRRQKYVAGPFYRFFITNAAGQGVIRLFISRGYQAASEPIEAINRAELAARMGSPVTFDRRGDIVFLDGFDSTLNAWQIDKTGAGEDAVVSTEYCDKGGFSCKLTTDAVNLNYSSIEHYMSVLGTSSRIGLEVGLSWSGVGPALQLCIMRYGSGTYQKGLMVLDTSVALGGKLGVVDAGVLTQIVTNLNLSGDYYSFHRVKLVIDLGTDTFVRTLLDATEYDISEYSLESGISPAPASILTYIKLVSTGDAEIAYVDSAIITQNEP